MKGFGPGRDPNPNTHRVSCPAPKFFSSAGRCDQVPEHTLARATSNHEKHDRFSYCPGDGNGDGVVDEQDVIDYTLIAKTWGLSSHYDFNIDGLTDDKDLDIILNSFGTCPRPNP